ncbi:HPr family phosphocarrier protein [Clostridium sp. KNHs216]|jgi:Phosphotransferase System HPr (HPr) Family|uniref:HPr family phosphocarrier protein n=1 Tax=Eubacteriales TaxID=186802 RepID=UPI00056F63B6|nr:HPr family phosphocarrier protein [Clostridium sp. KNHs216]MBE6831001.1 HPr family phosphocarrier protein [Oscillospiraceae bacterium]TQI66353.1 phosphocarrier protein HPr/phosphocarrier protein [Clostridium sp. KNHs216]
MKTFEYIVTAEEGLHARPAGLLAQAAKKCVSKITMTAAGKSADAKRLFAIMNLGVKKGDGVVFQIEGEGEETESRQLRDFCEKNL